MGTLEIRCFSGDPWSPSGMSDGDTATLYSVATETFTITKDTDTVKLWFSGKGEGCSGPRTTLIASAYITQGDKSTPVSVRGEYSNFIIPSSGCWSDTVSVADFTLPGDVSFIVNYVEATNLPTYSDNTVPTDPVPVSAVQSSWGTDIEYNTEDSIELYQVGSLEVQDGSDAGVTANGLTVNSGTDMWALGYVTFELSKYNPMAPATKFESYLVDINITVSALEAGSTHADSTMIWFGSFPNCYGVCLCSDGTAIYDGINTFGYTVIGGAAITGSNSIQALFTKRESGGYDLLFSVNGYTHTVTVDSFLQPSGLSFHTYSGQRTATLSSYSIITSDNIITMPWQDEFATSASYWSAGDRTPTITDSELELVDGCVSAYVNTGLVTVGSDLSSYFTITKYTVEIVAGIGDASALMISLIGPFVPCSVIIGGPGFSVYGAAGTEEFHPIAASISSGYHTYRFEGDSSTGIPSLRVYMDDIYYGVVVMKGYNDDPDMWRVPASITLASVGTVYIKEISIIDSIESDTRLTEIVKSGNITINANPSPGETFTVSNSATIVFTFVDHYPLNATQIQIGATTALTAQALATAINNISGAEFVATVDGSIISVDAYCESAFAMTTTSTGIEISSITEIVPGLTTETVTAADSFTATDGGKAVQENATAADSTDGLIDGSAESASVSTVFDTLNVEMDETIEATVTTDFDGLIDYMGEEI